MGKTPRPKKARGRPQIYETNEDRSEADRRIRANHEVRARRKRIITANPAGSPMRRLAEEGLPLPYRGRGKPGAKQQRAEEEFCGEVLRKLDAQGKEPAVQKALELGGVMEQ